MSKTKAALIGALALAGATTPIVWMQQSNASLRSENEELRRHTTMERPAVAAAGDSELQRLREENAELHRLRGEVAALRREAQAGADMKTEPARTTPSPNSKPKTPISEERIPASEWRNVGMATPQDAMQTFFWARRNQDTNTFANAMIWDLATKARLEKLLAAAPAEIRDRFDSLDGLIYQMALGGGDAPMKSFRIVSLESDGERAELIEEHQNEDGQVRQNPIKMYRHGEGWRVLMDEQRLEKIAMRLQQAAEGR